MTSTRHRATARLAARFGRLSRLAVLGSVATVATGTVVAVGVTGLPSDDTVRAQSSDISGSLGAAVAGADLQRLTDSRSGRTSRSAQRLAQPVALKPKATGHKFATAPLNIWQAPREVGRPQGLVDWGTRVAVTGQQIGHWAEVLLPDGKQQVVRWVNADYLANNKPKPEKPETDSSTSTTSSSSAPTTSGISTAPCPDGSATESGLTSSAVRLYRAVCGAFPALTTYGGYAPRGEHADGRAIDFMVSDSSEGQAVADWVQAHASELGIYDVIWAQRIWTPERASEGWRYMEDRGSPTANHYDHVHVAVN